MKKIIILIMLLLPTMTEAQSFRDKGYKGNVSYSNVYLAFHGLDSSHGYMFNEHHYLGCGIGVYSPLDGRNMVALHLFGEYTGYWIDRNSTPFCTMKVGWIKSIGEQWIDNFLIEPSVGWSWCVGRYGLSVSGGIKFCPSIWYEVIPSVSITFEF